ncbi:MAG: TauD/TfdA family dioxygenase [Pseudomonadota bacterium]
MPVTTTPISPLFGAELGGLDLERPIPVADAAAMRAALARHKLLRVHAPGLSPEGFIALAEALGEIEPFFLSAYSLKSHPQIYVLSNVRENGAPVGRDGAGFHWHSDHTFEEKPCAATLLHAVEAPDEGGDTLFVDMVDAYRRLSDEDKALIEGRRAVHAYRKAEFAFSAERDLDEAAAARVERLKAARAAEDAARAPSASADASGARPPVAHPIARRHPATGERALYLNQEMTTGVEGMDEDEGRALLARLLIHATPPEKIMRYRWTAGDVVIWDNAATMHAATYTDPEKRRVMHRLTIKGERPT